MSGPSTTWPPEPYTRPLFPPALHRLLKRKSDERDENDETPDVPAAKYRCPRPSPSPPDLNLEYVEPPPPVPRKRTGKGWRDIEREQKERQEKERKARIAEAIAQGADPMVVDPPPKPSLLVYVGKQIAARSRFLQQQRAQAQAEAEAQAAARRPPAPVAQAHAQQPAQGPSHTHGQPLTKAQADALAMPPPPLPAPRPQSSMTAPRPQPPRPAPRPWPPYDHDFGEERYKALRLKKIAALPRKPGDMLNMRPWTSPGPSPLRQSAVARPDGSFPLPDEDQIMVDDFAPWAITPAPAQCIQPPAARTLKVHKIERLNVPIPPLRPQLLFRLALNWLCFDATPAQIPPAQYAFSNRIWTDVVTTGPPIYWYMDPQPLPPPRGTPGARAGLPPYACASYGPQLRTDEQESRHYLYGRTGRLITAAERSERAGTEFRDLKYEVLGAGSRVFLDPPADSNFSSWRRFRDQFTREMVLQGQRVTVRPSEKSLVRWMMAGMKLRTKLKGQQVAAEVRAAGAAGARGA